MVILKTPQEIDKIRKASRIVAEILSELKAVIEVGMTTADIEEFIVKKIRTRGAKPAFKGYRGFPSSACISVNDVVIHGIPARNKKLKEGDIVGVDIGVYLDGFFGDAAYTYQVGRVGERALRLLKVTEESLYKGIEKAVVGNRISDISHSIQKHVEENGFSVVRSFVGHGIGSSLHEEPQVPNFGKAGQGYRIKEGMTLAIEPMVNEGGSEVKILNDGWTAVTADGSLSAHFEHTIAVTKNGPEILTKC